MKWSCSEQAQNILRGEICRSWYSRKTKKNLARWLQRVYWNWKLWHDEKNCWEPIWKGIDRDCQSLSQTHHMMMINDAADVITLNYYYCSVFSFALLRWCSMVFIRVEKSSPIRVQAEFDLAQQNMTRSVRKLTGLLVRRQSCRTACGWTLCGLDFSWVVHKWINIHENCLN